jgi:hypothetical protein
MWGPEFGRRDFFRLASAGISGYFLSSLLPGAASARPVGATLIGKARNCIFIHMQGAPSHVDTFDLKVGAWTPADFNPTAYNGVMFPQGLMPTLATHLDKLAVVRSVRAPALVHSLQQVWTQIARNPTSQMGRIAPNLGAVVASEFEAQRTASQKLPGFIALNGGSVVGNGYFSPRFTPFAAAANPNGLAGLTNGDGAAVFDRRFQMLMDLDGGLRANSPLGGGVIDMDSFYQQSRGMMYNAEVDTVFRFSTEDQQRYGSTGFGNSCIVARNLVRANLGTRYIQIGIGGWDNHSNIYVRPGGIYGPATQLDRGLGNLLSDLATTPGASGGTLLDETLIVAMGEFGRTVRSGNVVGLNNQQGRDHFFQHFVVFAGGGIKGGTIIGATTDDGGAVRSPGWSQNRNVTNEDIAATIYSALGIDYTTTRRDDPFGRGFEYVPFASEGVWYPILELFNTERARGSAQNPPPPAPAPRQRGGRRVDP